MEGGTTKEVQSLNQLQVTEKLFSNLSLIPMDTPYAPIAKLGYTVEPLDLPTSKEPSQDKNLSENKGKVS